MSVLSRLRDRRPPAAALAPLDREERVLSWGSTPDGGAVVATQLGLWLPGPPPHRIGWHLVDKAVWRSGTLTLTEAVDAGGGMLLEQPPQIVELAVPRDLPAIVRARVERSISYTRHHKLAPAGGVRIVGRRVPGRDGLTWQFVFDPDTDRDDPLLRAQAEQLVATAMVETGG